MKEKPPVSGEKPISQETKDLAIFAYFLERIKSGVCKLEELNEAKDKGIINLKEHDKLVSEFAERLESMVGVDSLTKLFDRSRLEPELNRVMRELNKEKEKRKFPVESIVILYFDITEFKKFNDKYGHDVGDRALVAVAKRLKEETRRNDVIFRLHGDEFVAILSVNDMDPQVLDMLLKDKKKSINNNLTVNIDHTEIPIHVSMGPEILHQGDIRTAKQVIKTADAKMYEDKNESKNRRR